MRLPPLMLLLMLLLNAPPAAAAVLRIAVASNFLPALESLRPQIESATRSQLRISSGASGQLATQILQGAPFDIFLSADDHYPAIIHARLNTNQPVTYALGQLWLVGLRPADHWHQLLASPHRVAIANPALAPYGRAAQALMQQHQMHPQGLVVASNIAQVRQWFDTGHVAAAWLAGSLKPATAASAFNMTAALAQPLAQQLVIVSDSDSARALVAFLLAPGTQKQLQQLGYDPLPERMND